MAVVSAVAVILAVVGAVVLRSHGLVPPRWFPGSGRGAWNVLLVSLDTTRPDRLAACDGGPVPTPALDRVRAGGVLFTEMVTPAPITLPAHASLFTGRYPYGHGARDNTEYRLAPGAATLAGAFRDAGYQTAAFVAAYVMKARFGLNQGFDLYQDELSGPEPGLMPYTVELPGQVVADRAAAWLRDVGVRRAAGREQQPFFLFVHFFDAHAPYQPPEPHAAAWRGRPYEGELAWQDACLGRVLDALDASGEAERTLVWVISDHGESLGEHGEPTHSLFVYDAALRVVSVLRLPHAGSPRGREPRLRVTAQTSLVDVAPTLLELCGVDAGPVPAPAAAPAPAGPGGSLASADGRSLAGLLSGAAATERPVYCETLSPYISYHWAPLHGVRTTEWKYIRAPEPELYNLRDDPHEIVNLAAERPEQLARLSAELDRFLAAAGEEPAAAAARSELDAEELERLRSLGYLGSARVETQEEAGRGRVAGGAPDVGAGAGAGGGSVDALPDPKVMVRFFNEQYQAAKSLLYARRHEEAAAALRAALEIDPLNNALHFNLGTALRHAGRADEAAAAFRASLRIEPRNSRAWLGLGRALLQSGAPDSALVAWRRAQEVQPASPDPWQALGDGLWAMGRYAEAAAAYDSALALDGIAAVLHGLLARLHLEYLGDQARATEHLHAFARLSGLSPDAALRRLPTPER